MIQDILTITAVVGASGYTIYSFVKILISAKQKKAHCSGCSACNVKEHVFKFDKKFN